MPPVAPNPVQADIGPALHGTPAPYGRACINCARAKCRCIYRTDGARCDRCHRLNKECSPSVSARRRSNKRQASSRTAQLEEKLEDLVTMLRNQNSVKPTSSSQSTHHGAPGIPTPSNNSLSDASPIGNSDGSDKPSPHENPTLRAAAYSNLFPDACEPNPFCDRKSDSVPLGSMIPCPNTPESRLEAEECLRTFRTQYLPTFPCVYLPPAVTAEQLREERPMLWFSIMVVTCQAPSRQVAMGDTFQQIVAQKVVIEHEKSMDILLGLLVFLGWSQYHRRDKPYISVYSQLTISLIFSLSLHKPPGGDSIMLCFKPYHFSKLASAAERTMEDRRAVLACFHITSQVGFTMSKLEGLLWTPYMDQCLDELSRNPATPNDEILVTQVRIQLVVEQLSRAPWQFYDPQVGVLGSAGPPLPFISALHLQREKIKKELPRSIERQDFINLQLFYTKLATLESGLSRKPTASSNPDFRRYDTCSKCLEATKDWFDIFFMIPISDYPAMAFTFWCQLMHCLISLYKLTILDEPAWDRSTVRDTIDLIDVCDRICERFTAVASKRPLTCGSQPSPDSSEGDMFVKSARMAYTMKTRWAAELAAMEKPPPPGAASGDTRTSGVAGDFVDNVTTGPMAVPMVITDDMWIPDNTWLTDVFNASWE